MTTDVNLQYTQWQTSKQASYYYSNGPFMHVYPFYGETKASNKFCLWEAKASLQFFFCKSNLIQSNFIIIEQIPHISLLPLKHRVKNQLSSRSLHKPKLFCSMSQLKCITRLLLTTFNTYQEYSGKRLKWPKSSWTKMVTEHWKALFKNRKVQK